MGWNGGCAGRVAGTIAADGLRAIESDEEGYPGMLPGYGEFLSRWEWEHRQRAAAARANGSPSQAASPSDREAHTLAQEVLLVWYDPEGEAQWMMVLRPDASQASPGRVVGPDPSDDPPNLDEPSCTSGVPLLPYSVDWSPYNLVHEAGSTAPFDARRSAQPEGETPSMMVLPADAWEASPGRAARPLLYDLSSPYAGPVEDRQRIPAGNVAVATLTIRFVDRPRFGRESWYRLRDRCGDPQRFVQQRPGEAELWTSRGTRSSNRPRGRRSREPPVQLAIVGP